MLQLTMCCTCLCACLFVCCSLQAEQALVPVLTVSTQNVVVKPLLGTHHRHYHHHTIVTHHQYTSAQHHYTPLLHTGQALLASKLVSHCTLSDATATHTNGSQIAACLPVRW